MATTAPKQNTAASRLTAVETAPGDPCILDAQALLEKYVAARQATVRICKPLAIEDHVVQPSAEVSPPKWHLAHTSWFFEEAVLKGHIKDYSPRDPLFQRLFNSYYKSAGEHWLQSQRGQLSRPTVAEVLTYREEIDEQVVELLNREPVPQSVLKTIELGLHHEQQHQELLYMDIKRILGSNPSMPAHTDTAPASVTAPRERWSTFAAGLYAMGHDGPGFAYDNECPRHQLYLRDFAIRDNTVSNGEFQAFMAAGGYEQPTLWLSQGWEWLQSENVNAPMYWFRKGDAWHHYTLYGEQAVDPQAPVTHVSYFEADAFARWAGQRLPTEAELEIWLGQRPVSVPGQGQVLQPIDAGAASNQVWYWSASHYSAYPGYKPYGGMLEEYNGKFMCGQFVLKGGSVVTPDFHYRHTYRNFFLPRQRWMFSGIKLARDE